MHQSESHGDGHAHGHGHKHGHKKNSKHCCDTQELKDAFDCFDVNKDGTISEQEVQNLLEKVGLDHCKEDVQEMMKEFDKNKDGKITFKEFSKVIKNKGFVRRSHTEIAEFFREFDTDGSGFLEKGEAVKAIKSLHPNLSDAKIGAIFDGMEKNDDSKFCLPELIKALVAATN